MSEKPMLSPCPFCFGEAENARPYRNIVICTACLARGPVEKTSRDAIAAWNRRVSSALPVEGVGTVTDDMVEKACVQHYGENFALWSDDGKKSTRGIIRAIIETALRADLTVGTEAKTDEPEISIKPMLLSGDRCDYFVSFKNGDREVTPHCFRERFKAEYHVALYRWFFGQGEKPGILEFNKDDWPGREYTVEEQQAFAALATPSAEPSEQKAVAWDVCKEDGTVTQNHRNESHARASADYFNAHGDKRTVKPLYYASPHPSGDRGSVKVKAPTEGEIGELIEQLNSGIEGGASANRIAKQAATALTILFAKLADAISTIRLLQDQYKRQSDHDTALIETAERKLEEARKALEPFASQAVRFDGVPGVVMIHDNVEIWQNGNYRCPITVGDLRRARALTAEGSDHD